jgi:hypothetical protein
MKRQYWIAALLLGVGALLGVLFFFAPDRYAFYPRCLFHSMTGLQCPGCGGLRAAHRLMHGDMAGAFHFNPLFVLLIPVCLALGGVTIVNRLSGRVWLPVLRQPFWLWLLLAVALIFGVGRNILA